MDLSLIGVEKQATACIVACQGHLQQGLQFWPNQIRQFPGATSIGVDAVDDDIAVID